jgi:OmcA/MtrC family decaheme c-type cytochrome
MPRLNSRIPWLTLIGMLVILICASLLVADGVLPKISKYSKVSAQALVDSQARLDYIRPGITLKILSATIGSDNSVKARFRIADPKGVPLDRDGIITPGPVTVRFMLAFIGKGTNRYIAYTKSATSGLPGTDANGTFQKVADGEYIYSFTTKLPANYETDVTTSIGAQASRNLSEFSLPNSVDNDVYNFVPNGAKVTELRDVVKTETCNGTCHDPISAHGSRRKVEYCIMCHQPDLVQASTGINMDFPVLIHKIHMGSSLPSVVAGKPYKIGNADFSKINLPSGARNCQVCHDPKSGATQQENWFSKPSRAACGSCHDNVNFATGQGHNDMPQVSDNQCANCHVPVGETERDISIRGAHKDTRLSNELMGITFEPISVQDGSAGKKPTLTFQIKDKNGNSVSPATMDRLSLILAGPSDDFQTYVSEDARKAEGPAGGPYFWTFANAIPAEAGGSFSISMEGYKNVTTLAGTTKQLVVRDTGKNKSIYFSVDGSQVAKRREVVSTDKCNQCHFMLEFHGRSRNTVEQCVKCHNPAKTETGRPAAMGGQQSISFRTMIHGIHAAEMREGGYAVYGGSGSKNDYSEVAYPGDLRNCQKCHINNTEQVSNMPATASPVVDPNAPISYVGPVTAACTACHNSPKTYAHATANTTAVGESCNVCHGTNSTFSVNKVHAR